MSETVRVSVIIPVYNGAAYIRRAIDSALKQDVELEVLVIDDGSTDDIDTVMQAYENEDRVTYLKNPENLGVAGTRNRGVSLSQAPYIAFLDADDWWEEGKLTKQLAAMEKAGAVLSSTGRELMSPDGTSTGRVIGLPARITMKEILKTNVISTSAVVARRAVLAAHPMEHDDSHEDYITWIRIIREHGFAIGIDEPYLLYRMSESSKSGNKLKSARMHYRAYRYCGLGVGTSLLHFISYAFHGVKKYYGSCGICAQTTPEAPDAGRGAAGGLPDRLCETCQIFPHRLRGRAS